MIIEYIKVIFAEMHDIIQKTFIIAKILRFCGHVRDILRFILLIYWPTMGNDSNIILFIMQDYKITEAYCCISSLQFSFYVT